MRVVAKNGNWVLTAETAADKDFIDSLHQAPERLHVLGFERGARQKNGGWPVIGVKLSVQADQTTAERDLGLQVVRCISNLQRLLGSEATTEQVPA